MAKIKNILSSGALGIGPKLVMDNPEMLRGLGLIPNLIANKLEDREEEKARQAAAGVQPPMPGMRKGGKVKKMKSGGYVRSADGCAQRGKTKGRFV